MISSDPNMKEAVAQRAYEIWVNRGRPHGQDQDHWLAAERELVAGNGTKRKARRASNGPSAARKALGAKNRTSRATKPQG